MVNNMCLHSIEEGSLVLISINAHGLIDYECKECGKHFLAVSYQEEKPRLAET
ncbi:hypothetical protein MHB43_21475 [Paenibacillus sp. FSL H8-0317]|uniref:hypothetical protein n=1 Tax=Paenibacillus sp. FSL H8-0317 TaxID=2921385 RepID=UPI003244ED6C